MNFEEFNRGTYQSLSKVIASDRTINLYPELIESGTGKAKYAFYGVPGTQLFCTLANGPISALSGFAQGPGVKEYLIAIAGTKIYAIDEVGAATLLGNVASSDFGSYIIQTDENTAFVLSGGLGYTVTIAPPAVVPVVLPAFAITATFLDNYGIISAVDSRTFYVSDVGDLTTWNPLNFGTKEAAPDFLQGVMAAYEQLWLFGLETTEVWYDSGAALFPFQRYPGGGVIDVGCSSPWSIAKIGNTLLWLGRDIRGQAVVYMANGMTPVRISTHAVEYAIRNYGSALGAAVAFTYQEGGHYFYVLDFPYASAVAANYSTWVYDLTTQQWHERLKWNGTVETGINYRHHAMAFFASNNPAAVQTAAHFVGGGTKGDTTGKIYKQNIDYFTFDGQAILRRRTAPHLSDGLRRNRYDRLILDLDRSSAVSMDLKYSDDGGLNYGATHTKALTAGSTARMMWRQLGSGRDRVFDVSSLSQIRHAWAECELDFQPAVKP